MKAVIETGGKQVRVQEGDVIQVEKLDVKKGDTYTFDKIVMVDNKVGTPYVKGATVEAKVEKNGKNKKIIIFKYLQKKSSHKKQGHRQPYTRLKITKINK